MSADLKIMSRPVWSKVIRLAHWLLTGTTLGLMVSGWLISNAPSVAQIASEYHQLIAALFAVSLGFRLVLLFTNSGAGKLEHMIAAWPDLSYFKQMGMFYLTLGKTECPKWFSHNFAWIPLYFLLFGLLLLQSISGILMIYDFTPLNLYPPEWHELISSLILYWVLFHLYAVILHDVKGQGADVSAMINGKRYFEVDLSSKTKPSNSFTINVMDIK